MSSHLELRHSTQNKCAGQIPETERNLGPCPRLFIMLTATLPGSNVLQNTFCYFLPAVLRQKMTARERSLKKKKTLETEREKTMASISSGIKREKSRHSIPPHEHTSNEIFLAKITDNKFDKACMCNYKFIGNKRD